MHTLYTKYTILIFIGVSAIVFQLSNFNFVQLQMTVDIIANYNNSILSSIGFQKDNEKDLHLIDDT